MRLESVKFAGFFVPAWALMRIETSQMRDGGTDIAVGQFRIEVKRRAKIGNVYEWMAQSENSCREPGQIPVVCARADGKQWLAIVNMDDFCRLIGNEL